MGKTTCTYKAEYGILHFSEFGISMTLESKQRNCYPTQLLYIVPSFILELTRLLWREVMIKLYAYGTSVGKSHMVM